MVRLTNLPLDSAIYYTVDMVPASTSVLLPFAGSGSGSGSGSAAAAAAAAAVGVMHQFRTPPAVPAPSLRFVAMADVGDPISHSWTAIPEMNRFCNATAHGLEPGQPFELGLHIGDIAYNLDIPPRGDDYVAGIAPMASSFPWMMTPGNHESDCNYTYKNFKGRFLAQNFTKPASEAAVSSNSSRWYSFERGPVHFIVLVWSIFQHVLFKKILEGSAGVSTLPSFSREVAVYFSTYS